MAYGLIRPSVVYRPISELFHWLRWF